MWGIYFIFADPRYNIMWLPILMSDVQYWQLLCRQWMCVKYDNMLHCFASGIRLRYSFFVGSHNLLQTCPKTTCSFLKVIFFTIIAGLSVRTKLSCTIIFLSLETSKDFSEYKLTVPASSIYDILEYKFFIGTVYEI